MKLEFRDLRADEIECRVSTVTEKGVSLLLYKDARCDMNILDETVGAENWQNKFYEQKGILFCSLGINTNYNNPNLPDRWLWKDDAGTESNTEAEKGNASDARKRSGFAFGLGRELYTSPFVWVKAGDCKIVEDKRAKNGLTCRDRFTVTDVEIKNKKIVKLEIRNDSNGKRVFAWGEKAIVPELEVVTPIKRGDSTLEQLDEITAKCELTKTNLTNLLGVYQANALVELTAKQAKDALDILNEKLRRQEERNANQG
jgi:hypothetical protein